MLVAKKKGVAKEDILKEWEDKKNSSIIRGNIIHDAIEQYNKSGIVTDESMAHLVKGISEFFLGYKESYDEVTLYSKKHKIAGKTDKICYRGKNIFDVFDYKTNERKGIEYFSKYNQYLLPPLQHLQDCNYNEYAVKISAYAYMLELRGYGIGKLAIIYIPPTKDKENPVYREIPVPYMKMEVEALFGYYAEKNNIVPDNSAEKMIW